MRALGFALLTLAGAVALLAPWLAPNAPDRRFDHLLYAPPSRLHLGLAEWTAPHIHPFKVVSRIERRYEEEPRAVRLRWFEGGVVVTAAPDSGAPLLVLGADGYGRDIFSRLLYGSRTTLALAVVSTAAATLLGAVFGAIAGYSRGWAGAMIARTSELVLVLPTIYVALALRAVLPLVLTPSAVFVLLTGIFALLGWPIVARGVRAIVLSEREREHVLAAQAMGAGPTRILVRHLLPAARGYLAVQATLLLPAFILAEATLSYIGFGFPDPVPTWGTMLQEAANVGLFADAPWMLAPALAIFIVVLAVNLVTQGAARPPVQLEA